MILQIMMLWKSIKKVSVGGPIVPSMHAELTRLKRFTAFHSRIHQVSALNKRRLLSPGSQNRQVGRFLECMDEMREQRQHLGVYGIQACPLMSRGAHTQESR